MPCISPPVAELDDVLYPCIGDTMLHVSSAAAPERVPHRGSAPWLRLLPSKQLDSARAFSGSLGHSGRDPGPSHLPCTLHILCGGWRGDSHLTTDSI